MTNDDTTPTARERILDAAAELVHAQGFTRTGLQEILAASDVPKGSFYYYFKSKEELGAALADHFAARMARDPGKLLRDASLPPMERLSAFLGRLRELFVQDGCRLGCPIGNMVLEMADVSDLVRERTAVILQRLSAAVAGVLAEAQAAGDIRQDVDSRDAADFVVNAMEGCLLRMKAERDDAPLRQCEAMLLEWLRPRAGDNGQPSQPTDNTEE